MRIVRVSELMVKLFQYNQSDKIYLLLGSSIQYKNIIITLKMSDLEGKIKIISSKYAELKRSDDDAEKESICDQIMKLSVVVQKQLEKQNPTSQKFRWSRQISDIKQKIMKIQQQINDSKLTQKKSAGRGADERQHPSSSEKVMTGQQIQKIVVRSIIEQEVAVQNLTVTAEQLEKLAVKMDQNLAVMEEIRSLIQEQGNNLQVIEENIVRAYDQTVEANKQLQAASLTKTRTRLLKIRLGIAGLFGTIGFTLMGIPGAIVAFVGGFKLAKFSKNRN